MNRDEFKKGLVSLLNEQGIDNGCNTPDFILAEYLITCLLAYTQLRMDVLEHEIKK